MNPQIFEVDEECNITYADGRQASCKYRPYYTFAECEPGYGAHGNCPKWDYYHREEE
jgi:hypothetical protein